LENAKYLENREQNFPKYKLLTLITELVAKRREIFLKGGKNHEELKIQLRDAYRKIRYQFD